MATARMDPADTEWQTRIQWHQQRRPPDWSTVQVPVELAATLAMASGSSCLLVDSLGSWLANLLDQSPADWTQTVQQLLLVLDQSPATIILVAEETGWGVVPAYPLGRTFRDRLGHLVRHIGYIADDVYLVTGGHALNLKVLGTPLPPHSS